MKNRDNFANYIEKKVLSFIRQWDMLCPGDKVVLGVSAQGDLPDDMIRSARDVKPRGSLREMDAYVWDLSSESKERVKKENDHAMDDMRYFVATILKRQESNSFIAYAVERRG